MRLKSLIRVAVLAAAFIFASGPPTWAATVLFPDGAFSEAFPFSGATAFVLFGNELSPPSARDDSGTSHAMARHSSPAQRLRLLDDFVRPQQH